MTWSIVCANKVVTTVAKNVKYDTKSCIKFGTDVQVSLSPLYEEHGKQSVSILLVHGVTSKVSNIIPRPWPLIPRLLLPQVFYFLQCANTEVHFYLFFPTGGSQQARESPAEAGGSRTHSV